MEGETRGLLTCPTDRDFKTFIRTVVVHAAGRRPLRRCDATSRSSSTRLKCRRRRPRPTSSPSAAAVVAGAYLKAKGAAPPLSRLARRRLRPRDRDARRGIELASAICAYKTAAPGAREQGREGRPTSGARPSPRTAEVLANSFAEYLAYGPGTANFVKLIYGFRPDENGNSAGVPAGVRGRRAGRTWRCWRPPGGSGLPTGK